MSFGSVVAMTLTGASLANNASRQGTAVGPLSGSPVDVELQVTVTSAASGVSATGIVNVYLAGSLDGTHYPDGAAGPDGAITPTVPNNAKLVATINVVATSKTYPSEVISMYQALGAVFPYFNVYITNLSGAALAATATITDYLVVS